MVVPARTTVHLTCHERALALPFATTATAAAIHLAGPSARIVLHGCHLSLRSPDTAPPSPRVISDTPSADTQPPLLAAGDASTAIILMHSIVRYPGAVRIR